MSVMVALFLAFVKLEPYCATSSPLEVKTFRARSTSPRWHAALAFPLRHFRFYEEKALIASVGRRGLRRLFEPNVLDRLALIALGRAAGFSLEEIASMFTPNGRPRIDREKLSAKAAELQKTIRRLERVRDGLRHAAACPAPSHMECPTFRRLLRAAAPRERGARASPGSR